MRSILIDWLIDVANHFDLNQETLHLAITYVDIYLSKTPVEKNKLQLVGVTAMKMAE
jgi:cyclin A